MARSYANIVTAIWDNEAFRRLNAVDQRTYLMLVTQPDISAAGVLAITDRRWARYAADTTIDDITGSLARLADTRFLVIDWDGDELLVRSFVRWDKGYTNPKRRMAIFAACREVRSPTVRRALAAELRRLGLPSGDLEDTPDSPSDSPSTPRDDQPIDAGLNTQEEGLSDSQSDAQSNGAGSVGTTGTTGSPTHHTPHSPTLQPASRLPEEERTAEAETALADAVRTIRPEWSARSIRRALSHPDVLDRPWSLVQAAMLAVAHDRTSQAPGRLPHDGPWWTPPRRPDPPRVLPAGDTDWRDRVPFGARPDPAVAERTRRGVAAAAAAIARSSEAT
ncbi:hypothetical protein [Dactylosporangium sp. NPDC000521]|uniref:hypothetical protein n=1 Tax=Dactylosporangium sp. NPDC000521 TaxID=3363975 RepID=UPI00368DAB01